MPEVPADDRDRGFLTTADRQYLRGASSLEEKSHSERRARERIRDRFLNALYDMTIVAEHLEKRDRDQVFDKLFAEDGEERKWGNNALRGMMALACEGAVNADHPFEPLVIHGVREAMGQHVSHELSFRVGADISFEVKQRSSQLPQMANVERMLDGGHAPRELEAGDQAVLFQQLLRRSDLDATELAIEEWNTFLEDAFSRQQESDNDE